LKNRKVGLRERQRKVPETFQRKMGRMWLGLVGRGKVQGGEGEKEGDMKGQ